MSRDDEDESRRAIARRGVREAGEHSSKLARELMQINDATLEKLELGEELLDKVRDARRVTAQVARRRAERTLAGDLRHEDIARIVTKLQNVRETGTAEPERMHAAERWRARMIEEGIDVIPTFTGGEPDHELPGLIAQARRERDTGKPAGAGRALFRYIVRVLETRES